MDSSPETSSSNDTDSSGSPPPSSPPPKKDSPSSSSSSPPPSKDNESPPSSPPPQSPPPSSPPQKNSSPPPASPPPSSQSSPSKDNNNNSNNSNNSNNNNNNNNNNQSPPPSPQSPPPSSTSNTPSPPNAPKNNQSPPSTALFSPPSPASSSPSPPRAHNLSPPLPSGSGRSSEKSTPNSDSSSSSNVGIIAGVAVGGIFILALIILCVWCTKRKKKQRYYMGPGPKGGDQYYNNNNQWNRRQSNMDHVMKVPQSDQMGTQGGGGGGGGAWASAPTNQAANSSSEFGSGFSGQAVPLPPQSPKMGGLGGFSQSQFTYEELAKATDSFSQANLLGQGGFGYVHKGVLADGKIVAIKSLKAGSGQGEREFQAEVEIISRVHHRHLVSLVGYCIANGQRMLVYEFVDNKTLEFHLHGKGQPVMDWETRLKIALGSAKGLAYLHEDCQHRIIHRDIKAANILLDLNYEALVADFGLAKLTSDNNTHVSTRVMGTFGYLAPEYASSGKLTEKSDVFSYGVMLLELITAKRPVDPSNMMEDSLVDWARPLLTRALEEEKYDGLVDARLEGKYNTDELHRMIGCAASSIRHSAKRRPKMSQIVRALEGNSSLEDLDNAKPVKVPSFSASNGVTQAYDTGMYNADMMKFRKMILPTQEFNSNEHGTSSE